MEELKRLTAPPVVRSGDSELIRTQKETIKIQKQTIRLLYVILTLLVLLDLAPILELYLRLQ